MKGGKANLQKLLIFGHLSIFLNASSAFACPKSSEWIVEVRGRIEFGAEYFEPGEKFDFETPNIHCQILNPHDELEQPDMSILTSDAARKSLSEYMDSLRATYIEKSSVTIDCLLPDRTVLSIAASYFRKRGEERGELKDAQFKFASKGTWDKQISISCREDVKGLREHQRDLQAGFHAWKEKKEIESFLQEEIK